MPAWCNSFEAFIEEARRIANVASLPVHKDDVKNWPEDEAPEVVSDGLFPFADGGGLP